MGLRRRGEGPRNEKGRFISLLKPRKQELESFYWQDRLTIEKIGKIFGVSSSTIHRWMKEYNIPRRRTTKNKMRRWNEKEKEKLKKIYPLSSRVEVEAQFPNRTWQSIRWEANKRLGLKLGHTRNNYWKEHEIEFLRKNYQKMKDREIACELGRSPSAVQMKRGELELMKGNCGDITKPDKPLNLTETEKAYSAGLVDGDGSIFLSYYQYPALSVKRGIHSQISCAVSCRSANEEYAEEVAELLGRNVTRVEENYFEVGISRQADILQFLEAIYPYLRLKRKQAEIMMEYCRERLKYLKDQRNAPYTPRCFELVEEMLKLNNTPMHLRDWK